MCQLFQSKEEAITIKELVKQCFAPTFIYPNPDTTSNKHPQNKVANV